LHIPTNNIALQRLEFKKSLSSIPEIKKNSHCFRGFSKTAEKEKRIFINRFSPNLSSTNKKRPLIRAFFAFIFFKILL
jgi:hypothetical protein